jgi:hypothetical protein
MDRVHDAVDQYTVDRRRREACERRGTPVLADHGWGG